MKKILSLTLTLALLCFSAACSELGNETDDGDDDAVATEQTTDIEVLNTEEENSATSLVNTDSETTEKTVNAEEETQGESEVQ